VAFTRALAMTICRSLKIDAEPVLALLPQLGDQGLDRVHQGLNTRFRERPGRLPPTDLSVLTRPALWLPLLAILAAVTIYLLPQGWIADLRPSADAASAMTASPPLTSASAPLAVAAAASTPLSEAGAAFPPPEAASAATAVAAELTGALQLRVSGESWVEVLDASGASLLQRALHPGEAVGLDGTPPFKVKIGNASAAQLTFRGQAVELKAVTRDNVARLELK
jgi:cytoskeleton protein RodZ